MATLATGLLAGFGRTGLAPVGFHRVVSSSPKLFPARSSETSYDGKCVISNDTGHYKGFFFGFLPWLGRPFPWCSASIFFYSLRSSRPPEPAQPACISSTRCCLPNISAVTFNHDESYELPFGRRVALITQSATVLRHNASQASPHRLHRSSDASVRDDRTPDSQFHPAT